MRVVRAVRSLGWARLALIGVAVIGLVAGALVLWSDGGDDSEQEVMSTDEPTTTSEGDEETTTSTVAPTTTTTVPTTTNTSAAPVPTTATPPPPPTTDPPPPPPSGGSLDMAAVYAFAKAHHNASVVPPQTYTGATQCPAYVKLPADGGDDTTGDITTWDLGRYCDGVYRFTMSLQVETPLDFFWFRADTAPGGCGGVDRVIVAWYPGSGGGHRAGMYATPTCDPSTWSWVDAVGSPIYSMAFLQLDFRGSALGDPATFSYRGGVQAKGESGAAVDVVPNGSPGTFRL
jgi:hypothetical protein